MIEEFEDFDNSTSAESCDYDSAFELEAAVAYLPDSPLSQVVGETTIERPQHEHDRPDQLSDAQRREAFLSQTEQKLLNRLDVALRKGDLHSVQESLATLSENPRLIKNVLKAIKARIEDAYSDWENGNGNRVRWETGIDSDGKAVVRLHIHQATGNPDRRGGPKLYTITNTNMMVGSDGIQSGSVSSTQFGPGPFLQPSQERALRPPEASQALSELLLRRK